MSNPYWLKDEQTARQRPYFRQSRGKPQVDHRQVSSAIVQSPQNLPWACRKVAYDRRKRRGEMGEFLRMMEGLAADADP